MIAGQPIFDPRSGRTVSSDNSALILADYLHNACDLPVDWESVKEAADICDSEVPIDEGR